MIKIIRVEQDEGDSPKFVMAIEPKVLPLLIEAGISALLGAGALEFIQMNKQQFAEHKEQDIPEEEKAKQEAEMWGDFLKSASTKDLPQA